MDYNIPGLLGCLYLLLSLGSQVFGSSQHFRFHHVADFVDDGNFIHLHVFLNTSSLFKQHTGLLTMLHNASSFKCAHPGNKNYYTRMMEFLYSDFKLSDERMVDLQTMLPNAGAPRSKRDVMGAIAIGISLYNTYEIHELRQQMSRQTDINESILLSIKKEDMHVQLNAKNIQKVRDVARKLIASTQALAERASLVAFYEEFRFFIHQHTREVERLGRAVGATLNGKFDYSVVDSKALKTAFVALERRGANRGYTLLDHNPAQVFTAPISYMPREEGIDIFVHLAATKGNQFRMYKYANLPFMLDKIQASIRTSEQYLVMDDEQEIGLVMTEQQFLGCSQFKEKIFCPELRAFDKNIASSCLGAIQTNKANLIKENCDLLMHPKPKQAAYRVQKNTFFVHSPYADIVKVTCSNGTSSYVAEGTMSIKLHPGCTHSFQTLAIKAEADPLVQEMPARKFLHIPLKNFSDWSFNTDVFGFQQALEELNTMVSPQPISYKTLERQIQQQKLENIEHGVHLGLIIIAVVVLVVLLVVVRHVRRRQQARRIYKKKKMQMKTLRRLKKEDDEVLKKDIC